MMKSKKIIWLLLIVFVNCKENFPPSNFEGYWSSEGDIEEPGRLNIQIDQIDNKIEGTISYWEFDENLEITKSSGLNGFSGEVKGGTAVIEIQNSKGKTYHKAKLIKDGDYMQFKSESKHPFYPNEIFTYSTDELVDLSDLPTLDKEENVVSNYLSLTDCVTIIENHCRGSNQQLIKYFETYFDGKPIYMFFTLSYEKPGYSCISAMTPYSENIIGTDCNLNEIKVSEWNELTDSPKILL